MRKIVVLTVCAVVLVSTAAISQSRSGEGVSRQMQALRTMLESFRSHVDSEITRVDGDISTVDGRVDAANTRMDTMDGRMDAMDTRMGAMDTRMNGMNSNINSNDRRITALENGETGVQVYRNCAQRNVTWGSGNCQGTQGPIPHGTSITVRDTVQGDICTNRYQHVGYAVYSCNDGVVTRNGQACRRTDFYNENLCESNTGGGDSGTNCNARRVTWQQTVRGRTVVCGGNVPSIPHGTTATDPRGGCNNRDFVSGSSTWRCTNGSLNMTSSSCNQYGDFGSNCR